jgi:hypothetical protein
MSTWRLDQNKKLCELTSMEDKFLDLGFCRRNFKDKAAV